MSKVIVILFSSHGAHRVGRGAPILHVFTERMQGMVLFFVREPRVMLLPHHSKRMKTLLTKILWAMVPAWTRRSFMNFNHRSPVIDSDS